MSSSRDEPTHSLAAGDGVFAAGAHLLIVEGASSSLFPLPSSGTVTVGRAPDCDLVINDAACSRRHLRLHIRDGEVTLEDLGSHNGTRVNGDAMVGTRALAGDDVIAIGPITIVLHAGQRSRRSAPLDATAVRERLAQEVERSVAYDRPLSVAVVGVDAASVEDAARTLAASCRVIDVVGRLDDRHLVAILPELRPEAARALCERALAQMASVEPSGFGVAHCPGDGFRSDALLSAARAASALPRGRVHEAVECATTIDVGGIGVIVADPAMSQVYDLLGRLAQSDLAVLVTGETGVGKENAAQAVHAWSRRASGPFVAINCASLPENLVESELFGFEKGAFSGAQAAKPGRFEAAAGGTVFFDEIGELPLAVQAKLLRVLESKRATRIGALKDYELDVRIVAATNRDLQAEVKAGRFREDLFFRLAGAKVVLPPLRDRPRELALLARHFLERACAGRDVPSLSAAALAALARHRWPGNVRELKNEMEYVAATVNDSVVEPWHLSERVTGSDAAEPAPLSAAASPSPSPFSRPVAEELRELERRRMIEALEAAGGVQKRAAELIGMPVRTFTLKYKQYGLGDR